ncbi:MAG: hypothetical protein KDC95_09635 [Planctomycetes bacterium]|nr:hypothetical protein [Planctomycetota bacterium]
MPRQYYELLFRLDRVEARLLWFTNHVDGVVVDPGGCVPAFEFKDGLMEFARSLGVVLTIEEPVLHDLDTVTAWLQAPCGEFIDCNTLLSAWNLFDDIAKSVDNDRARRFREVDASFPKRHYDKLFAGCNLPVFTPEGKHYDPIWNDSEVDDLSRLLALGLALFRNVVQLREGL